MVTKKTFLSIVLVIFLAIQATATLAFVDLTVGPTGLPFYDNNQEMIHFMAAFLLLLGFSWLGIRHVIDKENLRNAATSISVSTSLAIALWLFPTALYIRNKVFIDFLVAATFFIAVCWLGMRTFYGEHHETNAVKVIVVVLGLLLAIAFSTLQVTTFFSDSLIKTLLFLGGALIGTLLLTKLFGIDSAIGKLLFFLGSLLLLFLAFAGWNFFTFDGSNLGLDPAGFGSGGTFDFGSAGRGETWDRRGAIPTRFRSELGFGRNMNNYIGGMRSATPNFGNWWDKVSEWGKGAKDWIKKKWDEGIPNIFGKGNKTKSDDKKSGDEEKKDEEGSGVSDKGPWPGECRMDGNFNKDKTTFATAGDIKKYVAKIKELGKEIVYIDAFASVEYAGSGDGVRYNKALSERRVKTVAQLVKDAAKEIDFDLDIKIKARGQTDQFQKGTDESDYSPNRRYIIRTGTTSTFTPAPPLGRIVQCGGEDEDTADTSGKEEEEDKEKEEGDASRDSVIKDKIGDAIIGMFDKDDVEITEEGKQKAIKGPQVKIDKALEIINKGKSKKLTEEALRKCLAVKGASIEYEVTQAGVIAEAMNREEDLGNIIIGDKSIPAFIFWNGLKVSSGAFHRNCKEYLASLEVTPDVMYANVEIGKDGGYVITDELGQPATYECDGGEECVNVASGEGEGNASDQPINGTTNTTRTENITSTDTTEDEGLTTTQWALGIGGIAVAVLGFFYLRNRSRKGKRGKLAQAMDGLDELTGTTPNNNLGGKTGLDFMNNIQEYSKRVDEIAKKEPKIE